MKFLFKIYCVEYQLLSIRALDMHDVMNFFIMSVLEYYDEFLNIFSK